MMVITGNLKKDLNNSLSASVSLFRKSSIVRGLIGKLEPATGNGYFYINKTSFTGLVSFCMTYLVIMLQFS